MIHLIAGGYAELGAKGLYPLTLGEQSLRVGAPLAPLVNVSAGLPVTEDRWLLVDECDGRLLLVDAGRNWQVLATRPSGGVAPCHLAADGDLVAAANYESGTVALFRLATDTQAVIDPIDGHHGEGSGPEPDRQKGPHAHWVGFRPGDRLYAVDLGTDHILLFDFDRSAASLGAPRTAFVAPPGSGPRRLVFHPDRPVAYLVSELASSLTVLNVIDNGTMQAEQIVSTRAADADGDNLGGAIVLSDDGARLYVSNRGDDNIAAFAILPEGGVRLLGHAPSGGSSPRFLLLAANSLLVAHEKAGGVTVLALDDTGLPHPTRLRADVPGAAFLGVLP